MATDIGPTIGIDGEQKFNAAIANINSALRALAAQQKSVVASFNASTTAEQKNAARTEYLKNQIELLRKKQEEQAAAVARATATTNENSNATNNAKKAYYETTAELNKAKQGLNNLENGLEESGEKAEDAADKLVDFAGSVGSLMVAAKALQALKSLASGLGDIAQSAMDYESAFAGVEKTVDGTAAQMEILSAGIKDMSTEIPATAQEIAGVVEIAGQLGIATENVLDFSRVMIDLGESTKLSSEEAATSLARFMNITGTVPENVDRLGSAIVDLGNNFATDEQKITEMATRLASAGTIAGFTEPEILAVATAMSSVGIEAEAGGTAMTQTFNAITRAVEGGGDDLEKFSKVAGMSAKDFASAWKRSPAEALQAFIGGLGQLNESGESVTLMLDELGLSGVRQSNSLRALALASEMMGEAVDTANSAWEENVALTTEAAKRYSTTQSRVDAAANSFNNLETALGAAFLPQIGMLADAGNEVAQAFTELSESAPGAVSGVTAMATGLGAATAGLIAFKTAQKGLNFIGINKAALAAAGPWMALAAAIGLVTDRILSDKAALYDYAESLVPATNSVGKLKDQIEQLSEESEYYQRLMREDGTNLEALRQYEARQIKIKDLTEQLEELTKATEDNSIATLENMGANQQNEVAVEFITGSLEELEAAYMETYTAALESFQGQYDLFEKVDAIVLQTKEDMLGAMDSQTQYWQNYGANIDYINSLTDESIGLNAEFAKQLAESPEAAAGFAAAAQEALAAGADEFAAFIQQFNDAYAAKNEAMEAAADSLGMMQLELEAQTLAMSDTMTQFVEDMNQSAELDAAAKESIAGYISGLESLSGPLADKGEELARIFSAAFNNSVDLRTPTVKVGSNGNIAQVAGFATGLDYVPYDNFLARLHKGEMIVPADEAETLRSGGGAVTETVINLYPQTVDEATMDYIYNRFSHRMGAEI